MPCARAPVRHLVWPSRSPDLRLSGNAPARQPSNDTHESQIRPGQPGTARPPTACDPSPTAPCAQSNPHTQHNPADTEPHQQQSRAMADHAHMRCGRNVQQGRRTLRGTAHITPASQRGLCIRSLAEAPNLTAKRLPSSTKAASSGISHPGAPDLRRPPPFPASTALLSPSGPNHRAPNHQRAGARPRAPNAASIRSKLPRGVGTSTTNPHRLTSQQRPPRACRYPPRHRCPHPPAHRSRTDRAGTPSSS